MGSGFASRSDGVSDLVPRPYLRAQRATGGKRHTRTHVLQALPFSARVAALFVGCVPLSDKVPLRLVGMA